METLQIVEAGEKDVPVIRAIALAAWPVAYSRILSAGQIEYMLANWYSLAELHRQINNGVTFLMASHQQNIIGFTGFGLHEGDYKLFKIYMHPGALKTGAGKLLLKQTEIRCKAAGASRLILNVHRNNPSRGFYKKQGYTIYQSIDIPFGPGFVLNDYLMEKRL